MASRTRGTHALAAEGQVVEIFEKAHELRAKVLLNKGTVLDLAVGRSADVHLGDQVEIEGSITLHALRAKVDAGPSERDV
jgi:hypothetical protein